MTNSFSIGIDLGTISSCVGVWKNNHVEIIPNEFGKLKTPSRISFTDNERLIGDRAMNMGSSNYKNTVYDIKRLIGHNFYDEEVQSNMKNWPFKVIKKHNKAYVRVKSRDKTSDLTPEELLSMILLKKKEDAEKFLGQPVTDTVIAVPANFNSSQRSAIKGAGTIAGLNVLRIINEPTAAALTYGFNNEIDKEENVLIVDIGGGTFDASIININNNAFTVKATVGDTNLGGEDFTNRLVEHFSKEFKAKYNKDLSTNFKSLRRLREQCEKVKHTLSSFTDASIDIDYLFDDIDFSSTISRSCFEDLNNDLFEKIIQSIEKVVMDSKLEKSDIHEIVLVGGSTRIPKIRDMISSYFDNKNINKTVNVDEAVTCGAAVQAAILSGNVSEKTKDMIISDVIPHSIGIGIVKNNEEIMDVIIERNSSFPIKREKSFKFPYNQDPIPIKICEGDHYLLKNNNLLGEFYVNQNVPSHNNDNSFINILVRYLSSSIIKVKTIIKKPRSMKVKIAIEINENGNLDVSIEKKSDHHHHYKDINTYEFNSETLNEKEIDKMIKKTEKFKEEEKRENERIECMNNLEKYAYDLRKYIINKQNVSEISPDYIKYLNYDINYTIEWIKDNQNASKEEYEYEISYLRRKAKIILNQKKII